VEPIIFIFIIVMMNEFFFFFSFLLLLLQVDEAVGLASVYLRSTTSCATHTHTHHLALGFSVVW